MSLNVHPGTPCAYEKEGVDCYDDYIKSSGVGSVFIANHVR